MRKNIDLIIEGLETSRLNESSVSDVLLDVYSFLENNYSKDYAYLIRGTKFKDIADRDGMVEKEFYNAVSSEDGVKVILRLIDAIVTDYMNDDSSAWSNTIKQGNEAYRKLKSISK